MFAEQKRNDVYERQNLAREEVRRAIHAVPLRERRQADPARFVIWAVRAIARVFFEPPRLVRAIAPGRRPERRDELAAIDREHQRIYERIR